MSAPQHPNTITCTWIGQEWSSRYEQLPDIFMANVGRLNITHGEYHLITQLASYQWKERLPFPSLAVLSNRMGYSIRQLQRIASSLVEKGYLAIIPRFSGGKKLPGKKISSRGRQTSNAWDLSPLAPLILKAEAERLKEEAQAKRPRHVHGQPRQAPWLKGHARGDISDVPEHDASDTPGASETTHEANKEGENEEEDNLTLHVRIGRRSASPLVHQPSAAKGVEMSDLNEQPHAKPESSEVLNTCLDSEDEMSNNSRARLGEIQKVVAERQQDTRAQMDKNLARRRAKERASENLASKGNPKVRPFANRMWRDVWMPGMEKLFPEVALPVWEAKELGILKKLLEKYHWDYGLMETALKYMLANWKEIHGRFFPRAKSLGIPTVGFLLKFHDQLVIEAQRNKPAAHLEPLQKALEEAQKALDQHFKDDPYGADIQRTDSLKKRVREAQEALNAAKMKG